MKGSGVAIVPMGFCFPGHDKKGGDLPPRQECAERWHEAVFAAMPQIELLLAIGFYAQRWHLKDKCRQNLTRTVLGWKDILHETDNPRILPMPHPSWRNSGWLKKNPWFGRELLPELKVMVKNCL